jgi:hypothetical protein
MPSMALRKVYKGCLPVDASHYINRVLRGEDVVEEEIEGLDEPVTRTLVLQFTLDYPFEEPYEATVVGDAGV